MSADNWTVCPRCEAARDKTARRYSDEAVASYGKVTPEEYEALKAKARSFMLTPPEDTLREDYELGIRRGNFSVGYHAHCTVEGCGFEHSFQLNNVAVK